MKYFLLGCLLFIVFGCSIRKKINAEIQKTKMYGAQKDDGGKYAFRSRRYALDNLDDDFFEELDTLVLVEYYVPIRSNYSCTIFGNSVVGFYRHGLDPVRKTEFGLDTADWPKFDFFVYKKIKSGQLEEVIDRSKKAPPVTNITAISLFIIDIRGKKVKSKGFSIKRFRTDEEQARRDSLIREIKNNKDN